jgi:CDP-4-dehydro-6-deoxyglucose reductase
MQLVWIARSKTDRYQDNLCRSWQDAFENFDYLPMDTDLDDAKISTASILKSLNIKPDDLDKYDVYVAGNRTFIKVYEQNSGWTFMTTPPGPGNGG